jgi:RNA polymerase sigma-70 factor (ECF subfamily)
MSEERDEDRGAQSVAPAGQPPESLQAVLVRAVGRFCQGSLRHLRDDLVQSAWIRVLEVQRRGDPDRALSSSYLYKVAYSALIDEIRRLRRRGEVALDDAPQERQVDLRAVGPEQQAERYAIGQGIQECLQHMSSDRRLAVTLHLQGHTVPEAARILDWDTVRTKNMVYRGLADLRACLTSKGLTP